MELDPTFKSGSRSSSGFSKNSFYAAFKEWFWCLFSGSNFFLRFVGAVFAQCLCYFHSQMIFPQYLLISKIAERLCISRISTSGASIEPELCMVARLGIPIRPTENAASFYCECRRSFHLPRECPVGGTG